MILCDQSFQKILLKAVKQNLHECEFFTVVKAEGGGGGCTCTEILIIIFFILACLSKVDILCYFTGMNYSTFLN